VTNDDDDDVDDGEYKPVWPSGLWAISQGSEMSKAYNRTLPFIEASWQSTSFRLSIYYLLINSLNSP
jgi:hypothetical protein